MAGGDSFYEVLTRAINDFVQHGFDSVDRVAFWQDQLARAARRNMTSSNMMHQMLKNAMNAVFRRLVERGGVLKYHRKVERFMLERIKPQLRAELDRRILASTDLIKLNREQTIAKTLQRFSGWATSIPAGGSEVINKPRAKENIRKGLVGLPFEERRVLIDQSHKLTAAISRTMAEGSGAIAAVWRSNYRQPGYNYREDHKERDGEVYLLRDNWAQEKGLVKPSAAGYYDEITAAAEEPFCRCYIIWIYALRDLPATMLTAKGKSELERTRIDVDALKYRMDAEFREEDHPRDRLGRFAGGPVPGPAMERLHTIKARENSGLSDNMTPEEMQVLATEAANEMGYDGAKVKVTLEDMTFVLGDKVLDYAGAAYLHGERKGEITVHYNKVRPGFLGNLLAHEVFHQKWQAVWEQYQVEKEDLLTLVNDLNDAKQPFNHIMKVSGEVTPEYADKFPVYALVEPMLAGENWDKLKKDDGVTPYSTMWWEEYSSGKAHIGQAFHETLAEISSLYFLSGMWGQYRQVKGVSRLWMTFYHRVAKAYAEHIK